MQGRFLERELTGICPHQMELVYSRILGFLLGLLEHSLRKIETHNQSLFSHLFSQLDGYRTGPSAEVQGLVSFDRFALWVINFLSEPPVSRECNRMMKS